MSSLSRVQEQSYNREVSILIAIFVFLLLSDMGICSAAVNPHKSERQMQMPCLSCIDTVLRRGFLQLPDLHCSYQISVIPEIEDQILGRRCLVLVLVFFLSCTKASHSIQWIQGICQGFTQGERRSHHMERVCV